MSETVNFLRSLRRGAIGLKVLLPVLREEKNPLTI
jgi:hypothetical protein